MFNPKLTIQNNYRTYVLLVIFAGVLLRVIQFIYNRGLWYDEASLSLGLIDPNVSIFKPLPNEQSAPILFLIFERFFINLFGPGEMSLRTFPLICGIISLPLMENLTRQLSKNKLITLVSLFFFSFSPLLIRYSTEVKQYICDVFIIILLLTITAASFPKKLKFVYITITGVIGIFLSHVSVFILFGTYLFLFFEQIRSRKIYFPFYISALILFVAFSTNYILFIRNHPLKEFMMNYWDKAFMPQNPFRLEFWYWLADAFYMLFRSLFFGQVPSRILSVYIGCGIIGLISISGVFYHLKKRNYHLLFFTLFPVGFHLLISAAKIYPFHIRLILYLSPLLLIHFSSGICFISEQINKQFRDTGRLLIPILGIIAFLIINTNQYPVEVSAEKRLLTYAVNSKKEGDIIYINPHTERIFDYYKKIGRLSNEDICTFPNNNNPNTILKANRYWILFSNGITPKYQKLLELLQQPEETFKKTGQSKEVLILYTAR